MAGRFWTEKEDEVIRDMYPDNNTAVLVAVLNRSYSAVSNRANMLGVYKSAEFLASEASGRLKKEGHKGVLHRFKKGQTPPNKGKRLFEFMSEAGIAESSKTRFKKGNEPHNTKWDGAQRITKDGYIEQRVSKGKYRLLHRVNWEAVNGCVPEGFCLISKDGDKTNCSPDNWELISRAENMKRNSYHNYPKELANTIQLIGALNRQINKKTKSI